MNDLDVGVSVFLRENNLSISYSEVALHFIIYLFYLAEENLLLFYLA